MDIIFKEVEHRYQVNTPFERIALHDLNLNIQSGTFWLLLAILVLGNQQSYSI